MEEDLKKLVIDKILEIYPKATLKDMIVLNGSRAKGYETKESDIDIMIFTDDYDYYKEISLKKGLRSNNEDAGFELGLSNGLWLEVKIFSKKIPDFDVLLYHDLLNAVPLTTKNEFDILKKNLRENFTKHYEDLLFHSYVQFFNEFKNLEGISKRKDKLSKINLFMKKGLVVQALLRLMIVMDKRPFSFDKYLAHDSNKTSHASKIWSFIESIKKINSLEDYNKSKVLIRNYIDNKMPKKPYVANWWKYLNKFKELRKS